ncbi:hypothetical protein FRC0485_02347 [Corynebacterium diphtheriae]|nr:hypothetical protein FRC0485_02347 [Corynebacterium diphtheriae]
MRHESWQDECYTESWVEPDGEYCEADQAAHEGHDKADEHCVLCVGEYDGGVESWDCAGYYFGGDALERGDEFA